MPQSQPYRKKTTRRRGPALASMLRGKPQFRPNPQDVKRKATKNAPFKRPNLASFLVSVRRKRKS